MRCVPIRTRPRRRRRLSGRRVYLLHVPAEMRDFHAAFRTRNRVFLPFVRHDDDTLLVAHSAFKDLVCFCASAIFICPGYACRPSIPDCQLRKTLKAAPSA